METEGAGLTWVPAACSLPTVERPIRVMEFDAVFALARAVDRPSPTRLLLELPAAPGRAEDLRHLAAREMACCSFCTLVVRERGDAVTVEVEVPPAHVQVLDTIAQRVARSPDR